MQRGQLHETSCSTLQSCKPAIALFGVHRLGKMSGQGKALSREGPCLMLGLAGTPSKVLHGVAAPQQQSKGAALLHGDSQMPAARRPPSSPTLTQPPSAFYMLLLLQESRSWSRSWRSQVCDSNFSRPLLYTEPHQNHLGHPLQVGYCFQL